MSNDDKLPSLEELDKSIKAAKQKAKGPENSSRPASAMRVSADLLAGVIVGSVLGFHLDKWLDTKPWLFIICFFLGVAGSALNIYRSVQQDINEDE